MFFKSIIYCLLNMYHEIYDINKDQCVKSYISGVDMRPLIRETQQIEPSIVSLIENQQKYEWLSVLQLPFLNQQEKTEFIQKEMEGAYRTIRITEGGLMDDWAMVDWTME